MIVIFLVLNFVLSIFNAWSVGRSWVEARAAGGWARFMSWMGATMASVGFSWCYLVILAYAAGPAGSHKLPPTYVNGMFSLGYLILLVPLFGSGLAITLDSWAYFWRKRDFTSGAVAGWNTLADVYNAYEAARAVPGAWDAVKEMFKGSSSSSSDEDSAKGKLLLIALALCLCALVGGALTAAAIIRTVAAAKAFERRVACAGK